MVKRALIAALTALTAWLGAEAAKPAPVNDGLANTGGILPNLKRERPDMDAIRREVTDPRSVYYYPRLMEEYQRNDTAMKIDKYRRLYLGYMFEEDYSPYRSGEHPVTVNVLNRADRADADSILAYARRALDDDPFDLQQMMLLINALRQKGQTNLAAIWQYKLNYLLMAIVSTGTGRDTENAWIVIDPQHEYVLLNMMGYLVDDHKFIEPGFEYISVSDGNGRRRGGYYFNIITLLNEYYRKHPADLDEDPDAGPEAEGDADYLLDDGGEE